MFFFAFISVIDVEMRTVLRGFGNLGLCVTGLFCPVNASYPVVCPSGSYCGPTATAPTPCTGSLPLSNMASTSAAACQGYGSS